MSSPLSKMFTCLNCNKQNKIKRNNKNKFCNNKCQQHFVFKTKTLVLFFEGKVSNPRTLHRCMRETNSYECFLCFNAGVYNNQPLVLQLDHIDGNAGNNLPKNLRLLCPNCHSQTLTYVAKNKGKGRKSIGLKR
jgi:hypothetical protein